MSAVMDMSLAGGDIEGGHNDEERNKIDRLLGY
jgi:hypothetical protein